ncbi:MAG: ubiquinol-cytochrome C reductase [Alphaproteobacteria bacterium]|nr:ubiquinol-cytochrome C reductase [Alphaproteobacteria bacterium]|tara:strand:+ start:54329 stop:54736 length:408 start_codon:yes stop_codon:yes gene_type:complete
MQYWLVKSEPNKWSWDQQTEKGVEHWDGVRNYQASNNMKAMKIGDQAFFYHSNIGKEIVGIVEVVKEYYPDHTDESGRFGMVDFKAVKPLDTPVTLKEIKANPDLQDMALIKQSRLSVCPIQDDEWQTILKLGFK